MSIGCSIGMVMVTSAINYALQRWVLRSKPALMGFVAPATHEEAVKEEDSEPKDGALLSEE